MKKKLLAVGAMALTLSMASLPDQIAFASGEKETTSESKASEDNSDSTGNEKMDAAIKKWNALSSEKKEEVYKIMEEKQAVDDKLLDKFVSLGIMDKEDAKQIKADRKQMLSEVKEAGKLPMGGKKPPKGISKGKQSKQQKQE